MRGVKYRTKNIKISVPRAMAKVAKCKSPISEKYKAHFEKAYADENEKFLIEDE